MTETKLRFFDRAFVSIGEDLASVMSPGTAHIIAHGHHILSQQQAPGVTMTAHANTSGIHANLAIDEGATIEKPVHLCFGVFERTGSQNVDLVLKVGENARVTILSHCLLTQPEAASHDMNVRIEVASGAELTYNEAHLHGRTGLIEVRPTATVTIAPHGRFLADFSLAQGRVGTLDVDYTVSVGESGVAELTSKVYGHLDDSIRIREVVSLDGPHARGLVKTRVAVEDSASAEIIGATYGNAAGARGHVDCMEIVHGGGRVSAIPEVRVTHPGAKVTHEAAIGSVDTRQLETLMARGLTPDEAVDRIILGMLR
jgi:hypothetical protein